MHRQQTLVGHDSRDTAPQVGQIDGATGRGNAHSGDYSEQVFVCFQPRLAGRASVGLALRRLLLRGRPGGLQGVQEIDETPGPVSEVVGTQ